MNKLYKITRLKFFIIALKKFCAQFSTGAHVNTTEKNLIGIFNRVNANKYFSYEHSDQKIYVNSSDYIDKYFKSITVIY